MLLGQGEDVGQGVDILGCTSSNHWFRVSLLTHIHTIGRFYIPNSLWEFNHSPVGQLHAHQLRGVAIEALGSGAEVEQSSRDSCFVEADIKMKICDM